MADSAKLLVDIFNVLKRSVLPLNISSKDTVSRSWCAWKHNFLLLLKKEDINELCKDNWPNLLLMLIGPLGEQVYKNLYPIQSVPCTKDLEILLRDLDLYFIFGSKKKHNNESIDIYIDTLMLIAISSNHSDPVNIVKEKVIHDIKNYNFTEQAMLFIQSKGTNFELFLKSLNLDKINTFWKQCEQLESQVNNEVECIRCGTKHSRNRCPAHGMQCNNCKGFNHFIDYCKTTYVSDCTKCGMSHVQSRCPAFGKLCMNCGRKNHFTSLCQVPIVKDCSRCGKDHAVSTCPAQGQMCSRCNKPNHLVDKCVTKLNE